MLPLTTQAIFDRLQRIVSPTSAKLLLDTALIQAGMINIVFSDSLPEDQARSLVLKLINQGGPSFQVGQDLYKEYLMQ